MSNAVTLKDIGSLILLAGLTCGIVGFVHAQTGAGGSAGGTGKAGTCGSLGGAGQAGSGGAADGGSGMSGGTTGQPSSGTGGAQQTNRAALALDRACPVKKARLAIHPIPQVQDQPDNRQGWRQTRQQYRAMPGQELRRNLANINLT